MLFPLCQPTVFFKALAGVKQMSVHIPKNVQLPSAWIVISEVNDGNDWPFRRPRVAVRWPDDCCWPHRPGSRLQRRRRSSPSQTTTPVPSLPPPTSPRRPDCCHHPGPGWTAAEEGSAAGSASPEPLHNTTQLHRHSRRAPALQPHSTSLTCETVAADRTLWISVHRCVVETFEKARFDYLTEKHFHSRR